MTQKTVQTKRLVQENGVKLGAQPALLIVLSGPSGVGKGAVLEGASARLASLRRSISVTTRPPRACEVEGRDYFFRSSAEFATLQQQGEFLESAQYIDHSYGTPRSWVLEQLQQDHDVTLEIDVQGGLQVREKFPEAVLIFVAPPSEAALRERLTGRNTETEESLDRRVKAYRREIESLPKYDYLIVNDQLEDAIDLFICIIRAEKSRLSRKLTND
jgi:guanylate kinase